MKDLQGRSPVELAAVGRGLVVAGNQEANLTRVYTTYSASTPQIYMDIDRDKAQTLGVSIASVFNSLQTLLGSYYVNDFNLFGRTWQVNLQAEQEYRNDFNDITRNHVKNKNGEMVPLSAVAEPEPADEPDAPSLGFQGLRVSPPNQTSPQASAPSVVLPSITAPASLSNLTTAPSASGTRSLNGMAPQVVRMPAVSTRSFTP